MVDNLFTVYKSSAGSGKTFTLTREYLKLALKHPEQYKKILAVTFTNKATQEMKERIIQNLFQFSTGNTVGMGEQLQELLNLDSSQLISSSKRLLQAILHNYSRFSVQTIDRFFQNVMRSFARELSLQGDGELLLNTDEVRNAVVDLMMEDLSINQPLRDWLLEFSIEKLEQKGRWDIRKEVLSFTRELMSDEFKVKEEALGKSINDYGKLKAFKARMYGITQCFEDDLDKMGKEAVELIKSRGLSLADFSGGASRSAPNFFLKIQKDRKEFDFEKLYNKTVQKVIESGGESLATKTSKQKDVIFQLANDGLLNYFQKVADYIILNQKEYISAIQILRNIYLLGISWHFNERMQNYKQEEGIQFLSDTTQFLNEIIGTDPSESPFVYEKMGSFYDHFLMDEFQDTSTMQWQNFKPLIANSLAEGKENLVVGDIKQSIYRWRGGDWRLLLKGLQEDIPSHFYHEKALVQNYRSKPHVISFNNDLFKHLPEIVYQYALNRNSNAFTADVEKYLEDISMAYTDVVQKQKVNYDYQGVVKVNFFEDEEQDEEKVSWRRYALERFVADLEKLQDEGLKLGDVGILIRSRKEGIEIQDFLERYIIEKPEKALKYQYNIISDETLLLNHAHIVNFLLNCFRYLYDENNISLAQIKLYYQRIVANADLPIHEIVKVESDEKYLPEKFLLHKEQLLSLNLLEMSEQLIQLFALKEIEQEKAYLSAFQDVLLDFGNKGGIPDFLEWWEQNQHSYAIKLQAGEDAARMMTIHKAKGLEFKICMIPLLDWSITHIPTMAPTLWVDTQNTPFAEIPFLPLRHSSSLKNSVFALDYWQEEVKSFLDNLNLLYVAFTRAGDALLVNTRGNAGASYVSTLLKTYAEQHESAWDHENQSFQMGDLNDFKKMARATETKVSTLSTVGLHYYESHTWQNKLTIKQNNILKAEDEGLSKTDIGIQVHNVFSKLTKLDNLPVLLKKLEAEGSLNTDDYQKVVQLVEGNLQAKSPLIQWFSNDWEVKTEVPVLLPDGSLIRLDRVLLKEKEARILDFKTGMKDVKDERQVSFYKKSLKNMGYSKVTAHIAYLNPLEIIEIN
ncbi:DNA helicase [Marivirga lumbricoides]|uniref:DNA 3'-5' helicase n=1 Tax=Marivirga lumbricoides TaxID=1046115 RepID=A0ABQ1MZP8_9BACT|nr:DNA helicase [Marivirga lumbricoides]